jgi:hypothetical protein
MAAPTSPLETATVTTTATALDMDYVGGTVTAPTAQAVAIVGSTRTSAAMPSAQEA